MATLRIHFHAVSVGAFAALMIGCSGRPGRVSTPDVDPDEAAALAVQEYDRNADGQLDESELQKCPSLLDARPVYDADKNGLLSPQEIAAGIESWEKRGIGAVQLEFNIRLDGRPLSDAEVKLIPAAFLGDAVKPATGIADAGGYGSFNMAAEDRPANAPKNLAVIQPGLYNVEITHPTVNIPAKYNSSTTLGLEASIAGQNPAGVTWSLTSK
jgi:hypothetical protein